MSCAFRRRRNVILLRTAVCAIESYTIVRQWHVLLYDFSAVQVMVLKYSIVQISSLRKPFDELNERLVQKIMTRALIQAGQ